MDSYLLQSIKHTPDIDVPEDTKKPMEAMGDTGDVGGDLGDLLKKGGKNVAKYAGRLATMAVIFSGESWSMFLKAVLDIVGLMSDFLFLLLRPFLMPVFEMMGDIALWLQDLVEARRTPFDVSTPSSLIGELAAILIEGFGEASAGLVKVGTRIMEGVTELLEGDFSEESKRQLSQAWDDVKRSASRLWDAVQSYLSSQMTIWKSVIQDPEIRDAVWDSIDAVWDSLKTAWKLPWKGIKYLATVRLSWANIVAHAQWIKDGIQAAGQKFEDLINFIGAGLVDYFVNTPLDEMRKGLLAIMDAIDWMFSPFYLDKVPGFPPEGGVVGATTL